MIKIIKKSMFFLVMLSLMVPMAGGALAVETESYILPGVHISEMESIKLPDFSINELTIPTQFWDLSVYNYQATLTLVSTSWLYTNYYFRPNSSGEIHWKYYINPSSPQDIRIGVLDISANTIRYYTYTVPPRTSISFSSYFYGLDTSKNYAVCVASASTNGYTFSGSGIIGHQPINA